MQEATPYPEHSPGMGGATVDARSELVDLIVHGAFYPVLMVDRASPDKAAVERAKDVARAEIDRFRDCGSAEEVVAQFRRRTAGGSAAEIDGELKRLHLPVLGDFCNEFDRRARELGLEPDRVLRSFC